MMTRLKGIISGERGFTLAEVLVAVVVILVGLVAIASGFQFGTSGVATGRGETTAVFLAEQRLEQIKTVAMTNYYGGWPTGPSLNGVAPNNVTTEFCQATNIGATSSNCQATALSGTSYTRVTTVTDNPGGTGCDGAGIPARVCKRIRVSVTYRPVTSQGDGSQTRSVDLFAIVTPRN
jgi:prepilin-type N-terminal cleavage/methylation domain-containing protein